jgi:ankyrin repeat protein
MRSTITAGLRYITVLGDWEFMKRLIEKDYQVDATDNYGETALDLALRYGDREAAKRLINNGAVNRMQVLIL